MGKKKLLKKRFKKPLGALIVILSLFVVSMPFQNKRLHKKTLTGFIIKVSDGDTVVVAPTGNKRKFTCRLYGIDAPETEKPHKPGQPYGEAAASVLTEMILRKTVRIELTGERTYNREVCIISLDGMDVNLEMIRKGYAWAYRKYLKGERAGRYIKAEKRAKSKGLGLWQNKNPIPPAKFKSLYWDKT
ncbi:MAG: hypothetical protein IEMM0002_1225 [bacterium]|nr:MAG: hypothetical protein IEMM0002_1225 [bacterium]